MKLSPKQMQVVAWTLSLGAAALAFVAWGQGYRWQFSNFSLYRLFPLLGLLAFSLMWSHYLAAAIRMCKGVGSAVLRSYFEITSGLVLVLILLHPGILGWQLWQDGLGLPPGSYKLYIGAAAYMWILVGLLSLIIFLAYELRRWFGKRSWWRIVQYGSDGAMFLIFLHGLRLGTHLRKGWFRGVWYVYGLTLVASLVYMYVIYPRRQKIAKDT